MAMVRKSFDFADYVMPLDMNGLQGRMLRLPALRKNNGLEILVVYEHRASLEACQGLFRALSHFGGVTAPDLPGFGGMDSFYRIGRRPTIDNFADYLAAFMKLRFKYKKFVLVGVGFGFVVATRTLQRYPELVEKIKLLISIDGFADSEDFGLNTRRQRTYAWRARLLSWRLPSLMLRYGVLNKAVLGRLYTRSWRRAEKQDERTPDAFERLLRSKLDLWQSHDTRTVMFTTKELLTFSNCSRQVGLPLWHVATKAGTPFDTYLLEQHMRTIYSDFIRLKSQRPQVLRELLADEKSAASLIPAKLKRELLKV